jgi:hypothetical protein
VGVDGVFEFGLANGNCGGGSFAEIVFEFDAEEFPTLALLLLRAGLVGAAVFGLDVVSLLANAPAFPSTRTWFMPLFPARSRTSARICKSPVAASGQNVAVPTIGFAAPVARALSIATVLQSGLPAT